MKPVTRPGNWPPPSPSPGLQVALTHLEAVTASTLKATLLAQLLKGDLDTRGSCLLTLSTASGLGINFFLEPSPFRPPCGCSHRRVRIRAL